MKFDVKDVKSWATRNEVELGKIGFFADSIEQFYKEECVISKLSLITKIDAFSFGDENNNSYAFFLPLDAVKKDKPEKKYRPFKDLYEFYQFLSISPFPRGEFRTEFLLKFSFTYREKILPQIATTITITRIDVGSDNDPCSTFINRKDLKDWFDNYEIMNSKGEWLPFGVEVKND